MAVLTGCAVLIGIIFLIISPEDCLGGCVDDISDARSKVRDAEDQIHC